MSHDRCDFCKDKTDVNAMDGNEVNEVNEISTLDTKKPCLCHKISSLVFKVCMSHTIVYKIDLI